ncbi:MAG: pullulanase [Candidatus Marinimicrobia bacterium]|nr:pullulanase [Candidatus Neomarinimicrobiota bacterium]MCF7923058.1 pullulanase [Candidatus Neomarinimicrobiota bacterium]
MSPMKIILSLAMFVMIVACRNHSESVKEMKSSDINIAAVDEILGLSRAADGMTFRLFAPKATQVNLILFEKYDDLDGKTFAMTVKANGVWGITIPDASLTKYYAYSMDSTKLIIPDPYSQAIVRKNHFTYLSKSIILPQDNFDWQGDNFSSAAIGDLIILESHLRDMTAHASSGAQQPGTYQGMVETAQKGGLAHLKDMGYNAIEFLPLQEFGNIEIDYMNPELATLNHWNPYETNHWGYMTSYFFAPEIYYGSDGISDRGAWVGQDGRAVREMKEMVRALHKEGIAVILDVVYNHVSQYDENPFKLIDKDYYFRLDKDGEYLSLSGCGNDFKTENPMARKMIIESLLHWMQEYHIDGFRFDLAAMIDLETIDAITAATQAINPDVILIGEPWGGGKYNPSELADHGWASWNDHFRNSVKGRSPRDNDDGFIFGKLWDGKDLEHYKKLMCGYLQSEGGHYRQPSQSVNYLESHDDNTLGDFIRLALGKVGETQAVTREQVARLSSEELVIHKLAALNLLTSQGPVMIAQGQSWGRAKVIANSVGNDPKAGQLDHNSYEKDDETNWLNWDEKALNQELVDYYRGLAAIRHQYAEIRNVDIGYRQFIEGTNKLSFGVSMAGKHQVLVLLNGNRKSISNFTLPPGQWTILADANRADPEGLGTVEKVARVVRQSGLILVQEG